MSSCAIRHMVPEAMDDGMLVRFRVHTVRSALSGHPKCKKISPLNKRPLNARRGENPPNRHLTNLMMYPWLLAYEICFQSSSYLLRFAQNTAKRQQNGIRPNNCASELCPKEICDFRLLLLPQNLRRVHVDELRSTVR